MDNECDSFESSVWVSCSINDNLKNYDPFHAVMIFTCGAIGKRMTRLTTGKTKFVTAKA